MARKLDKSRKYGNIFGVHEYGAVFEQDGACFNVQGDEVGPGASTPKPDAPRPGAAGPAPTEPAPAPTPAAEPVPAPETAAKPGISEADLNALHPAQIKRLVEEEGLKPIGGTGSKKANIQLLLEAAAK